ncbi:hypothetical protein ABVT39_000140 [Epinephelus coioides]
MHYGKIRPFTEEKNGGCNSGTSLNTLLSVTDSNTTDNIIDYLRNTVSNLIMILPPIYGAIQTIRDGLELRYICSFLGLAAVGVGSWCFHMTLLYEMQLLDELPMIYSTCVFVYCL